MARLGYHSYQSYDAAGSYTLRLKILGAGEFNLNWFEFSNVITGFSTNNGKSLFYPNPTKEFINIKDPDFDNFSILTLNGSKSHVRSNTPKRFTII